MYPGPLSKATISESSAMPGGSSDCLVVGKEGRREGGKEGRREGGKEGRREGGKEGRREGGKEGMRGFRV